MSEHRPTHAGGIVYRLRDGAPEFLLVTARRRPGEWVLPKGHVEAGESPEAAALREVAEEAGVVAQTEEPLDDLSLVVGGDEQRIRFYLMRSLREERAREGRRLAWLPADAAIRRLSFPEARALVRAALEALERRGAVR